MRHLLDQRLTGELLRTAGKVLGRVGGALCYNRWSRCRGWVHHGGRAWWVVLVWPLLGHVWYWRFMQRDYTGKMFCWTSLKIWTKPESWRKKEVEVLKEGRLIPQLAWIHHDSLQDDIFSTCLWKDELSEDEKHFIKLLPKGKLSPDTTCQKQFSSLFFCHSELTKTIINVRRSVTCTAVSIYTCACHTTVYNMHLRRGTALGMELIQWRSINQALVMPINVTATQLWLLLCSSVCY